MSDFDRIVTSAPVNRQAAMQAQPGEHWEPSRQFTERIMRAPPNMAPESFYAWKAADNRDWVDLRGRVVGRLTVVGAAIVQRHNSGHRWVCRCACGNYVFSTAKAVKQQRRDRCPECHYVDWLRSGMKPQSRKAQP